MRQFSRTSGWVLGAAAVMGSAALVAGCGGGGGGGGGAGSTVSPITSGQSGDLVALEISPPGDLVVEEGLNSGFQVIVDGYYRDASVLDLTRAVDIVIADETVVRHAGEGLLTPVAPGTTTVEVSQTSATGERLTVTKTVTVTADDGVDPSFMGGSLKIFPEFRTLAQVDAAAGRDQLQQVVIVGTDAAGRMYDLSRSNGVAVQDMNRNASTAGQISPSGLFRGIVDGQEVLLVSRIDAAGLVAGCQLVLGSGSARPVPPSALYSGAPLAQSSHPLDQAVLAALRAQFVEPSGLAGDDEFLRRLYADALGRVPTEAEVTTFKGSTSATKRDAEIDAVLAKPEFNARWASLFAEWFEIPRTAAAFDTWAQGEIGAGRSLADMVGALAAGTGAGAAPFDAEHADAAAKVRILMLASTGMTAECAQCHNHPLTGANDNPKWTQAERYPLDAFFAANNAEATPLDKNNNRIGQPFQPGFASLDATKTVVSTLTTPIAQRRAEFATLLTGSRQFKRGLAHRIFAEVAQPLLDPNQFLQKNLDAVTTPAVLDALTTQFDATGASLKGFLGSIFKSKFYQLTSAGKSAANDPLLARHVIRRNHSEVMESLVQTVTGQPIVNGDLTFFRQSFGFPATRQEIHERSNNVNLSQSLIFMNSPLVHAKLAAQTGQIATLAAQVPGTLTQEQAITRVFRLALSRDPSSDELGFALDTVRQAPSVRAGLEDVAAVVMATIEAGAR